MGFTFPKTWKELEAIVNAGALDELSVTYKRSAQLAQRYENDRRVISKEQALQNIHDEIAAHRETLPTGEEVSLTSNRYPYDLLLQDLPGVSHVLLWFKGDLSPERAQEYLRSLGKTCCLYENPVALKSIPEINHYQIFVLDNVKSFPFPAMRRLIAKNLLPRKRA